MSHAAVGADATASRHAHLHPRPELIKAVVYTLLVINLGLYFHQDWQTAEKLLLPEGFSLLEFVRRYATTLDDLAWLVLLLVYELESAWIETAARGVLYWVRRAACVLCYAVIVAVLCIYALDLNALYDVTALSGAVSPCTLADQNVHYLYNQDYTSIRAANCAELGGAPPYLRLHDGSITDANGYSLAMLQARLSVIESAVWIIIVMAVAMVLSLQKRGNSEGLLIRCGTAVSLGGFVLIAAMTLAWAWMGHYVYLWDNTLWIGGFMIIEMNLSAWRRELLDDKAAASRAAS